MSCKCRRTPPVDPCGMRSRRAASSMLISARVESFSNSPNSNAPTTVNRRIIGLAPTGVALSLGAITVTLSPGPTPNRVASPIPTMMPYSPARRSASFPDSIFSSTSDTRVSKTGSTPLKKAPDDSLPCSQTPSSIKGAAPFTSSRFSTPSITDRQSIRAPSMGCIVACAIAPRIRVRNSVSKPFMTEITVISVVTPNAIPNMEIREINEIK